MKFCANTQLLKELLLTNSVTRKMHITGFSSLFRTFSRVSKAVTDYGAFKDNNQIAKQLYSRIKVMGPITIADYMKEVLISPVGGYYMHKDVIGAGGDFITSPELSQMFGEMVAVWCINEWSKTGCPKPFQIIELGPGKGSLSEDVLRVFQQFQLLKTCSLALVEVSSHFSNVQAKTLCSQANDVTDLSSLYYKEGISHHGIPIKWYRRIDDVPEMFSIILAHEYFDALPIHQFKKTEEGYREVLIDITENEECFRYVIARNETPASKTFIQPTESRDYVEVSPESLLSVKTIANRLKTHGGLALLADYGHIGEGQDTFRAFKDHKLHDPLNQPGTADLTADVNFRQLKEIALENNGVLVFGPVTQREFLLKMGIEHRYKALEARASKKELEAIKFGYDMMLNEGNMGNRFKFMSLVPATMKPILDKFPVVGF